MHYGTSTLPDTTPVAEFSPKQAALAKINYRTDVNYAVAPKLYQWEMNRLRALTTDAQLKEQIARLQSMPLGGPKRDPNSMVFEGASLPPQALPDGIDQSVRRVQAALGLPQTGFVDALMWQALGQPYVKGQNGIATGDKKTVSQSVPVAPAPIHPAVWVFVGGVVAYAIFSLASKET